MLPVQICQIRQSKLEKNTYKIRMSWVTHPDILLYFEKIILHPIRPTATSYKAHIFLVTNVYNFVKKELQGKPRRVPCFFDLLCKNAVAV